ncbi:hypothetical protein [Streptomyces sp. UNOB3_S3]|uniref:hypothetical protein n=1 Tax=Streptomyces sp. UNOB3_S3 TaxID=2871682 RepID=UPI001E315545|nr:hypothetical protein [Streptomyces sp. UNOB3_S3]MCC3776654.1 hypothetical protein [Streptomyces sp. UNOB3_S3]
MNASPAKVRFGGVVALLLACLVGGFSACGLPFAAGIAGTRGTLTVETHEYTTGSRGGVNVTSQGTFRSSDGRVVDHRARVEPDYAMGRRVEVAKAPWTYYVVHPAYALGWLAATCLGLTLLCVSVPALIHGGPMNAKRTRIQARLLKGGFCCALVGGLLGAILDVAM